MGRLFLLLIVALALAPGTWVRPPLPPPDERQLLFVDSLRVPDRRVGEVEVAAVWRLRSPNMRFFGYSALLAVGGGNLIAFNDGGQLMRLKPPGSGRPTVWLGVFGYLTDEDKRYKDLEGVTRDPESGTVWATFENTNLIRRYDRNLTPSGTIQPPQMENWPANTGPESIARLRDGRFMVLSEGNPRWFASGFPGLIFPGDPLAGAKGEEFKFSGPEGFRPVDMAQLPDGRVLILMRQVLWRLPPRFENVLVVADPAEIEPERPWTGRVIAHFAPPLPVDNYEGIAIEPAEGGRVVLWLISDDNHGRFQRTLLLKLLWDPNEKARGSPRAPR